MSNRTAPGLYFQELDFTSYAEVLGNTRVAVVGGARKGPIGKPTICTSEGSLIQKFGKPLSTDYGLLSALEAIRGGSQVVYLRVANSPATSSRTFAGTTGGTAAVKAAGTVTFTASANPADGDNITIGDGTNSRTFEFDSNGAITGGRVGVLIGTTAAATMSNFINALNNSILAVTAVDATVTVPVANLTADTAGTAGNVTITKVGTNITVTGMAGGAAAVAGSSGSVMTVTAASPGSWGNDVQVEVIKPSTVVGAVSTSFDLNVYAPSEPGATPSLVERFRNLTLTVTDSRFVETAIANGIADEQTASDYIRVDALTTGSPDAVGATTLGQGGGTVGTDGVSGLVPADYVGTVTAGGATGLQAIADPDQNEFNVLAIPGNTHQTVVNAAIALAESRADFIYLVDVPFGVSADDAVSWVNGQQPAGVPNSPASALNSSYAAAFAPWMKKYDPYNKVDIWLPPSGFVAGAFGRTDRTAGPWFAVAGPTRGLVRGVTLEYSPPRATQDLMIGDNNLNPLVDRGGVGVIINGNKTLQRSASMTQDLHVRRMLNHAKKLIATSVLYLQWEPNDSTTWHKFELLCNAPLAGIAAGRGLVQFQVVCNESTNPPELRAQKTMRGKLVVQPQGVAEKISFDFSITSTGTVFSDDSTGLSGVGA